MCGYKNAYWAWSSHRLKQYESTVSGSELGKQEQEECDEGSFKDPTGLLAQCSGAENKLTMPQRPG